jgi:hypothetical protein
MREQRIRSQPTTITRVRSRPYRDPRAEPDEP